jgi:carotenoid cleavage dioxygenase-like enzyme
VDSPIVIDLMQLLKGGLPVRFDQSKPTFIHVISKKTGVIKTYKCPSAFYLFHFSKVIENKETIEIYAPLYDDVDFSQLNIQGKYRKIVLEKASNLVRVEKNRVLEGLDLDFPVAFDDKIVLRYIENKIIKGFAICKDMKQIRSITLRNRFVCGEPVVINAEGTPYLICFANSMQRSESFLIVIELNTYHIREFSLGNRSLNLGFHSIFLHHKKNRALNNPGKESGALLENGHFKNVQNEIPENRISGKNHL